MKATNLGVLAKPFRRRSTAKTSHRAIMTLDDIVNYCKSTVVEMDVLSLQPDKYSLEMALHIREGARCAGAWFCAPGDRSRRFRRRCQCCARKAERTVEKAYRRAIVELFQGDDYLNMFKRRETYRHMSNAG
jgi:hypothetical protein